jgi:hypothetical protein
MFNRVPTGLLIVASCAALATEAQAATIQPRLTAGYQDYDITFADVTAANATGGHVFRDGFDIGDRVSFVGAGLTWSGSRLFLDLSAQRSESGDDQLFQFQGTAIGNGVFSGGNGHNHLLTSRFDRDEYNAAVGWGFTPEFSAYVGYKHATLDMRNQLIPVLSPFPGIGDVLFIGERVIDFEYDGAFIGGTYSLPVERWGGAFSLQSSLAFLDGEFKERFDGSVAVVGQFFNLIPLDPSFVNGTIRGESRGFNVGISWTGGFGWMSKRLSNLSYTLGLDRSEYDFETDQSTTGNFQEKNTRLRLDLRYRFRTDGA